jgi:hypothetical protein
VHVQHVRLFLLGVTTLADISSSDRNTFCDWVLPVDKNPHKPVFQFPHQECPRAPNVIATWQRIKRLCYAPLKLRYWNDPCKDGIKDASTKCGIPLLTARTALSIYGSMDTMYICTSMDSMHDEDSKQHSTFPLICVPISGQFHGGIFHAPILQQQ